MEIINSKSQRAIDEGLVEIHDLRELSDLPLYTKFLHNYEKGVILPSEEAPTYPMSCKCCMYRNGYCASIDCFGNGVRGNVYFSKID